MTFTTDHSRICPHHGNVTAINSLIAEMLGGRFVIGPSGSDPSHVLMAAIEAVGQAAEQLDKHFALGKTREVFEIRQHAWASVTTHVHWLSRFNLDPQGLRGVDARTPQQSGLVLASSGDISSPTRRTCAKLPTSGPSPPTRHPL